MAEDRKATLPGLGGRIKEARERAKLVQEQLGVAVQRERNTVSRWERGETQPGDSMITRLGEFLGVTPEWLKTGAARDTGAHDLTPDEEDYLNLYRRLEPNFRAGIREAMRVLPQTEAVE